MADFCLALRARVLTCPRDPPGKRTRATGEGTRGYRATEKKFEAAELRRVEWNRRIRRLDETGAPMRPEKVFSILEKRIRVGSGSGSRSGLGSSSAADPDPVGISDASAVENERARRLASEAARAQGAGGGRRRRKTRPGAAARWVKASDYLESAVEKTASGHSDLESVTDAETNGESTEEEAAAEDAREGSTAPSASFDARGEPSTRTEVPDPRVGVRRRTRAHAFCRVRARARAHAFCRVRARARATRYVESAPSSATPRRPASRGKGKIFRPEIVHDGMDDLTNIPGLTPAQEAEIAAEIRRIEQMYGDDRSISAEELDAKCMEVIDKYGSGEAIHRGRDVRPQERPGRSREAPLGGGSFYWRKLKVIHPVFEARPDTQTTSVLTMMMTHPGLPATPGTVSRRIRITSSA